jgi:asparagine synthase (glutamine-hydrolysing)
MCALPGGILNDLWGFELFSAARSAGHNIMLTGEMGNHTMSYDGWGLFTELLLNFRWARLLAEIGSSGYRWQRHVRQQVIAPLIPFRFFRKYKQWRRGRNPPWHNYAIIRPEFAAEMNVIDRADHGFMPFDAPPSRRRKHRRLNLCLGLHEDAEMLAKIRAGFSLDLRMPAYDRRIVEFCIGIPEDQFLRHGRDRWLIRRAMEGRLPECVLNQKKSGAQAADWYRRLTRSRTAIIEDVNRLAENPDVGSILDMERLRTILASWPVQQPPEYTSEEANLLAIADAIGTAYFIESLTGRNLAATAG